MARIATITNDQILQAARSVFIEQGINATTVDVATRAGISSASIFKRYPTKEALFFAAMSQMPHERIWSPELETAIGHGDPKADLLRIAGRIAAFSADTLPRMMLLRTSGITPGELGGSPVSLPAPPRVEQDFVALSAYFGREMARGRIARGDPTIPALALFHTASGFAMSLTLQSALELFDATSFLADFVALLWRGLEPKKARK